MFDSGKIYKKSSLFLWIIGYLAAFVLAVDVQETITINKIKSPKKEPRNSSGKLQILFIF